ncbi:hypothetical protein RYX36_015508 [Vicia faba]
MDILNEYLSSQAEYIASSLYSYALRAKRRRNSNGYHCCSYRYHGLQTLIHSEATKLPGRILHCYNMDKTRIALSQGDKTSLLWERLSKSLWSSSPGRSSVMGDLIGTESGDCMSYDLLELLSQDQSQKKGFIFKEKKKVEKEFPPAITLLRESGGGMPWCIKKECSEDGRLVFRTERVKCYYENMEAQRENGRLTMRFIHHHNEDDDGWLVGNFDEDEENNNYEFEKELTKEFDSNEIRKNEIGRCWADFRPCVSYNGRGFARDSGSFCMDQPSSAPLQPIAYVM